MASHGVGNHSLAGCSFANWEAQAALTNEGLAAGGDNDDGSVRPTKKRRASLRVGMTPRSEDVGVFKCKACGKDLRPQRFEDHAPWSVILQHKWSRVASVQLISPDKDTPHCVYHIYFCEVCSFAFKGYWFTVSYSIHLPQHLHRRWPWPKQRKASTT